MMRPEPIMKKYKTAATVSHTPLAKKVMPRGFNDLIFILSVFVFGNCLRKDLFRFYWSLLLIAFRKNNVTTQAEKANMDEGAFNDNEGRKSVAGGADLLFG